MKWHGLQNIMVNRNYVKVFVPQCVSESNECKYNYDDVQKVSELVSGIVTIKFRARK